MPLGGTEEEAVGDDVTEFEGRNQRLGVGQRGNGTAFTSAVTSHTIWFHRPFRTDGWLLLRQHSPLLAHSRAFGRGDMLSDDGTLVASYAQEALLRFVS